MYIIGHSRRTSTMQNPKSKSPLRNSPPPPQDCTFSQRNIITSMIGPFSRTWSVWNSTTKRFQAEPMFRKPEPCTIQRTPEEHFFSLVEHHYCRELDSNLTFLWNLENSADSYNRGIPFQLPSRTPRQKPWTINHPKNPRGTLFAKIVRFIRGTYLQRSIIKCT